MMMTKRLSDLFLKFQDPTCICVTIEAQVAKTLDILSNLIKTILYKNATFRAIFTPFFCSS